MKFVTFLASEYATLSSNVHTGGGTDDTAALQALLDQAGDEQGVRLIMDGAALVSQLLLNSNTVIECLSKDCGFYQMDHADCSILCTRHMDPHILAVHNITLTGGTYNQNCLHQVHDRPVKDWERPAASKDEGDSGNKWIFGVEFYGIRDLLVRDVTIRDFRTFGFTVGGFKNVTIENVWFDLPSHMDGNQDGFHFWGPGQFLTVKNVGGTVGDDFMNIGSDEIDYESSITDVLVDGVFLDHADQGIRLLSREEGILDRITVRNVTGTYRSFGFYIDSWFRFTSGGNFHDIVFENISLQSEAPNYDYRDPMLFSVGGNIHCLTLRNIRVFRPHDARALLELGPVSSTPYTEVAKSRPVKIENVIIDGLTLIEEDSHKDAEYILIFEPVQNLFISNVTVLRSGEGADTGSLIAFRKDGSVDTLLMRDIYSTGFRTLVTEPARVGRTISSNVITQ